jgi:hypothetical protein
MVAPEIVAPVLLSYTDPLMFALLAVTYVGEGPGVGVVLGVG